MKKLTKFSILVVTLNAEKEIDTTIESIQSQSYQNYEVVIKDGVSKDNTLKHIPRDDRYKVYSQRDTSVYDGMNQAIKCASGEYIIFLNAGDAFFNSTVLEDINQFIVANEIKEPCVLYGDYSRGSNSVQYQPRKLTGFYLYRKPLCHQSILYSSSILKNNQYDTSYKISADHELTLRLWKSATLFKHTGLVICQYIGGGLSETIDGKALAVKEKRYSIEKYYSKSELLRYDFIMRVSLSGVRNWILSPNSPAILRKFYRAVRNRLSK